jgi:hypothetical protein
VLLLLLRVTPLCPSASTSASLAPTPRAAASLVRAPAFKDDQGRRKAWAVSGVLLLDSAECCRMKLLATLLAAVLATRCATFCWRSFKNSRGSGCSVQMQSGSSSGSSSMPCQQSTPLEKHLVHVMTMGHGYPSQRDCCPCHRMHAPGPVGATWAAVACKLRMHVNTHKVHCGPAKATALQHMYDGVGQTMRSCNEHPVAHHM